jgi:hypothetical protein
MSRVTFPVVVMFACGATAALGTIGVMFAPGAENVAGWGLITGVSLAGFFTLAWRLT